MNQAEQQVRAIIGGVFIWSRRTERGSAVGSVKNGRVNILIFDRAAAHRATLLQMKALPDYLTVLVIK